MEHVPATFSTVPLWHSVVPVVPCAKSPLIEIELMVSGFVLTFFTLTFLNAVVLATMTLPNDRLVGWKANGELAAPVAVPIKFTSCGLYAKPDAVSVMATVPFTLPFAVGVKVTLIVHLLAAFKVAGLAPHGVAPPGITPKLPLAI